MIRLLFFMNLTGFLFFILCTILFPYRKDFLPSRVRIFICRLNMMFYIIPFPLFLPYFSSGVGVANSLREMSCGAGAVWGGWGGREAALDTLTLGYHGTPK